MAETRRSSEHSVEGELCVKAFEGPWQAAQQGVAGAKMEKVGRNPAQIVGCLTDTNFRVFLAQQSLD